MNVAFFAQGVGQILNGANPISRPTRAIIAQVLIMRWGTGVLDNKCSPQKHKLHSLLSSLFVFLQKYCLSTIYTFQSLSHQSGHHIIPVPAMI